MKKYIGDYLRLNLKSDFDFFDFVPNEEDLKIIDSAPGVWSIDHQLVRGFLFLIEKYKPKSILELGAGYSTIVFTYAKISGKGIEKVISFEEDPKWFKIPETIKSLIDLEDINIVDSKVKFKFGLFGVYAFYQATKKFKFKDTIDLVFIDGPQFFYGREGGLDYIFKFLKEGSLIVMDDAGRYIDQCVIFKWLKVYKGLELVYFNEKYGDKGLAILKVKSPLKRTFSISAFLLGMYQGMKRIWNINFSRKKKVLSI
ncbi:class I SAM-dependent methyltransferase [Algoriphagus antarcticus]|uniref:Putative O-methyltransferase YrrM n=1 Tax=Algoriphagus antarcticus TaxID=238540 RepID=A0A3E0DZL1_9BACT|nr:class I SAM-dependent methyltransferase [Algoriphagus antarcticus]REG91524.1 putative O-methyltransferase YrrM [Algoriphagus antarcticus]